LCNDERQLPGKLSGSRRPLAAGAALTVSAAKRPVPAASGNIDLSRVRLTREQVSKGITNMAAKEIFKMKNDFSQGSTVGICTCISLNWARKVLKKGSAINSYDQIGLTDLTLNAQMAQLRKLDNNPAGQCELVQLEPVGGDQNIASVDDIIRIVKTTVPHVAIFWTATHTMGYRYAHNEKEFFDNEVGLFRAKTTKEIKAKMNTVISGYGAVTGLRVVKLQS
jgi:hypothetical protein